jgi:hypothetical protein
VHSHSRFFRDAFGQEFYLRKLAGVSLLARSDLIRIPAQASEPVLRQALVLRALLLTSDGGRLEPALAAE